MLSRILTLVLATSSLFAGTFDQSHSAWTEILQQYVEVDGAESRVNYEKLDRNRAALDRYLKQLEAVSPEEYRQWPRREQLAFLINAYNAFTLKLVIDHYPIGSLKDLSGWFSSPWKWKFFSLLGEKKSLDEIEHGMIRKDFNEPRIHFALNCASVSCPPLRREAYQADRLDRQLEEGALVFLRDKRRNRYVASENRLMLSRIFSWYGGDFRESYGSMENFIASRITDDPGIQERIRQGRVRIGYFDYDWALNDGIAPNGQP